MRGSASRATSTSVIEPRPDNRMVGLSVHEVHGLDHGRRHGGCGAARRATSAPTRSACRPINACTCAAGATRRTRPTSPSTPRCGARRRWRPRAARRFAVAGIGVDDVAHLDLYSCFGSSVNFARDALGIADDDARPLTVTGGLPYHGGAGSNYMTHSIATMADVLRADPGSFGLVSGVGMHMTKHVFGVYSTEPGPVAPPDAGARPGASSTRVPSPDIVERHDGDATVAAYSVVHGRDGDPEWARARVRRADRRACVRAPHRRSCAVRGRGDRARRRSGPPDTDRRSTCRPAERASVTPPPSVGTEGRSDSHHGMGLLDRARVPGEARLDRRVRPDEIEPLDLAFSSHVVYDRSHPVHEKVIRPLQEQVKEQRPLGVPPRPRPRRPRLRPAEARA